MHQNRSCSTSWWENNARVARCFPKTSSVFEPIISVQEQQKNRATLFAPLRCKTNHTDQCYVEYNKRSLRRGFGQLKDVRYEKKEPGKPSLIVHSPTFEKSDEEIAQLTVDVLKAVELRELRKRFALVHTPKSIYIIGGYLFDYEQQTRRKPLQDYRYDVQSRQLISIPSIPNGAIGFGLCCDAERIYAAGGNDVNNAPLTECYYLSMAPGPEVWSKLPDLPAPTCGPGLGVFDGELHCIGGFDILRNESIAHGEYLRLVYQKDREWHFTSEIDPPRARGIVMIIPDRTPRGRSVYVAGGFNAHPNTHQPYIVPDLQLYDENQKRWQPLTIIPHLELSHVLSFSDNKLYVNEVKEEADSFSVSKILRTFDLQEKTWHEGPTDQRKQPQPQSPPPLSPSDSSPIFSPTEEKILLDSPIKTKNPSPQTSSYPITKQPNSQQKVLMKNKQMVSLKSKTPMKSMKHVDAKSKLTKKK